MPHPVPPPAPPPLVQVVPSETGSDASAVVDAPASADITLKAISSQEPLTIAPVSFSGTALAATPAAHPSAEALAGTIDVRLGIAAPEPIPVVLQAVQFSYRKGVPVATSFTDSSSPEGSGDGAGSAESGADGVQTSPALPDAVEAGSGETQAEASLPEVSEETAAEASPGRPQFQRPPMPPRAVNPAAAAATQHVRQQRLEVLGDDPILPDPEAVPPAQFGVQPLSVDLGRSPEPAPQSLSDQRILLEGEDLPFEILEELRQLAGATLVAQTRGTPDNPAGDRQILTIPGTGDEAIPLEGEPRSIPLEGSSPEGSSPEDSAPVEPSPDSIPLNPDIPTIDSPSVDPGTVPPATPSPTGEEIPGASPFSADVLELDADYQEFDTERDIFVAEGNVELRFRQAVLTADRIRVNLRNRQTLAEGNVVFRRGEQILIGNRLEYNLVQGLGNISGVRGEIFLPSSDNDLAFLPNDISSQSLPNRPISSSRQEIDRDNPEGQGGISLGLGVDPTNDSGQAGLSGNLRRLRFEADDVEFYPNGWQASNVRITNDPFSPPELELRSHSVTYTRLSPFRAEILARDPQLVFDQDFRLPLFQERIIIDSRRRNREPLASIGYDEDLGGLYLERPFNLITTRRASFSIAPLILVQRAIDDNSFNFLAPSSLGVITRFDYDFGPRTTLSWRSILESLELEDFEDNFRTNLRLRQAVGTGPATHQLTLEYAYRNEFFNGSLNFQEVESSIGFIVTSPTFQLGQTGIGLSYQAGVQYITATTDREEFFDPPFQRPLRDEVSLWRGQASAALSRSFTLWQGTPLPPTREAGLRFNPVPVQPFLRIVTGLRGVYSTYSNNDVQAGLTASVGLRGVLGHHARDTFDYTEFNINFSTSIQDGSSPFRFDRAVDRNVLALGFLQQIYGPILFGIQTRINLDRNTEIDTVYTLEYRRRTYSVILRFSPVRESGSLNLQINDFDWGTLRDPFSGPAGASTVEGGVIFSDD